MSHTTRPSMIPVIDRSGAGARPPATRAGRVTPGLRRMLLVASVSVLTFGALSVGALSVGALSASTSGCGAPSRGMARVIVIVDDGIHDASITCVVVPRGTNGSRLLIARADQLGAAVPTHAGSGLLCTIDSFPSSGCAETAGGSYWANFSGTGGDWIYSEYNPFLRRVCDGDVEGWRYVVHGSGAAGDATPRVVAGSLTLSDAWGCDEPADAVAVGAAPEATGSAPEPGALRVPDPAVADGAAIVAGDGAADGAGAAGQAGRSTTAVDGSTAVNAAVAPIGSVPASQSASTPWIGVAAVVLVIAGLGLAALLRSRRTA